MWTLHDTPFMSFFPAIFQQFLFIFNIATIAHRHIDNVKSEWKEVCWGMPHGALVLCVSRLISLYIATIFTDIVLCFMCAKISCMHKISLCIVWNSSSWSCAETFNLHYCSVHLYEINVAIFCQVELWSLCISTQMVSVNTNRFIRHSDKQIIAQLSILCSLKHIALTKIQRFKPPFSYAFNSAHLWMLYNKISDGKTFSKT